MLQGGNGYIGGPDGGNGQGYYSLVALETVGGLTAGGRTYTISHGYSWVDHQFGSIGPDTRKAQV